MDQDLRYGSVVAVADSIDRQMVGGMAGEAWSQPQDSY